MPDGVFWSLGWEAVVESQPVGGGVCFAIVVVVITVTVSIVLFWSTYEACIGAGPEEVSRTVPAFRVQEHYVVFCQLTELLQGKAPVGVGWVMEVKRSRIGIGVGIPRVDIIVVIRQIIDVVLTVNGRGSGRGGAELKGSEKREVGEESADEGWFENGCAEGVWPGEEQGSAVVAASLDVVEGGQDVFG